MVCFVVKSTMFNLAKDLNFLSRNYLLAHKIVLAGLSSVTIPVAMILTEAPFSYFFGE